MSGRFALQLPATIKANISPWVFRNMNSPRLEMPHLKPAPNSSGLLWASSLTTIANHMCSSLKTDMTFRSLSLPLSVSVLGPPTGAEAKIFTVQYR